MMKQLIRRSGRSILAGAGIFLSALTGCQTPGTQVAMPWGNARQPDQPNAVAGTMPTSPAFGRVQAGQSLPMMQQGMMPQQMMAAAYPQPGMMPQQMMAQQPVMGSGGMVYPVSYQQPGQPPMMMAPPMQQQIMAPQQINYAPPPGSATLYTPAAPVTQAPPVVPAAPVPGVTVTQGPNGPITVTTEILDQPPTAAPQPSGPTFNAPAPYVVPAPEAPTLAPVSRTPDLLPNSLGKGASGPSLPGLQPPPGLGAYPAIPVGHQHVTPPTRLPAPTGPTSEDDIPSAPVFLPGK